MEYFDTDIYIPSVSVDEDTKEMKASYTWVSKELANEAVRKGWLSSP